MRKRKPKSRQESSLVEITPHRTSGGCLVPGLTEGHAEYESRHEFHALITLLLCHDVSKIVSQPSRESYFHEGMERYYTPDFSVETFVSGLRLEVKALQYLVCREGLDKYVAIAKSLRDSGVSFAFLTDAQLEIKPRFSNVRLLVRYVTSEVPIAIVQEACKALESGPLTVSELLERTSLGLVDVWTLIARRHLCFDWMQALNPATTLVSLPGQPYGGLKLEDVIGSSRYGGLLAELALGRRPTDKRMLANAATWRRTSQNYNPWAVAGGVQFGGALRPRNPDEPISRVFERRRDSESHPQISLPPLGE